MIYELYLLSDLDTLMENTRYLMLLAKVYSAVDKAEESQLVLQQARDMQARWHSQNTSFFLPLFLNSLSPMNIE